MGRDRSTELPGEWSRLAAIGALITAVGWALLSAANLMGQADSAGGRVTAIEADLVYTMVGPPLTGATIIVRDGKVAAIGEQLEVPPGVERLRVAVLMPGLIDASSSAGIAGGAAEQTEEVTPELSILAALDWRSRDFLEAAAEGTTALHILPGTANVFAGGACVVKTAGSTDARILLERSGGLVALCADPTAGNTSRARPDSIYVRQPTNRMGVVWIIRAQFQRALTVAASPEVDSRMAALQRLLSGEESLFVVSRTGHDIQTVLTLRREFGFRPIIVSGEESYLVLDELAAEGIPVIFQGMTTAATRGPEGTSLFWNTPGQLEQAGVPFCLAGGRLLDQARFALRFGASEEAALHAITLGPARILGIDGRVGSIAVGQDADLIGLSGPPLDATTRLLWTMVDGRRLRWSGRNNNE